MKQAIVLAGDEGKRLWPFTTNRPKAMLSIAGKPLIRYVIESLTQQGIRNIIIVVGYKREQIFDCIGSGKQLGVNVTYITQDQQLGTAHALLQAKGTTEQEFLVVPGDKLIEPDTIAQIVMASPPALLAKRVNNSLKYSVITVENSMVKNIIEKPGQPENNIINTGIYAFNPEVFDYIQGELDIPNAINRMLQEGKPVRAVETKALWLDVVYPWDILSINAAAMQRIPVRHDGTVEKGVSLIGSVTVGRDTVIRTNSYIVGPVVIGKGCVIGPSVVIFPSTTIADNVVISPFTEIRNSVIASDTNIGPGSCIQDSVIDTGCFIAGHFYACSAEADVKIESEHHFVKVGAMLGEGCRVDMCVTAQPGAVVGNHSEVKSLKVITGRIPDRSLLI